MRKILMVALLAASPAAADVTITGPADAPTFVLTSRAHVLTGEIASPRGRRERLLLDLTTVTRETLGEKGIEGTAEISARPADKDSRPLFTLALPGRTATLDNDGFIAIDEDDCCALHRAFRNVATGDLLFETTVPTVALTLEGPGWKRRVAAFVAAMDGRDQLRAWGDKAIGVVTYAASDRVIRQVLVEAVDAETARRLRSLSDERMALAWIDRRSGAPIVTVPERGAVEPALRLQFLTSGIELDIPLRNDDLAPSTTVGQIKLTPEQDNPIVGGWRVTAAVPAPWAVGEQAMPLKGRYILFASNRVLSAGSVLDCGRATYERAHVPPEGLFLGAGLTSAQAATVGLTDPLAPTLTLTCDTGIFPLHRTPDGRWVFALDNVLYTLERAVE